MYYIITIWSAQSKVKSSELLYFQLAKETEELQSSEKFKKVTEATQETLKTAAEDFYDPTRLKESEIYRLLQF